MAEKRTEKKNGKDRRSESRSLTDQYASVELSISNLAPVYMFKVRDISSSGVGILVKEDSEVLKYLKEGDVLMMTYNPLEPTEDPRQLKTEIRHVTADDEEKFKGHSVVGLSIVDKQESDS